MNLLKFTLEKYKSSRSRYDCPYCGAKKTFTRYINCYGDYLGEHVGRCDRESNCGAHFTPKSFFLENNMPPIFACMKQVTKPTIRTEFSTVDYSILERTLSNYECNMFTSYLKQLIGSENAIKLAEKYKLGTTKDGRVIYWQIDDKGLVRSGKIMGYNLDGHRNKSIKPQWAHCIMKMENFKLSQCLFGLHLVNDNIKPIAIVEAEKTAVICSHYLPEFTWLSCGGLNNLNADKLASIKNREVFLFPDAGCFESWKSKIQNLKQRIIVSDWLENNTTIKEKSLGIDLADVIENKIQTDY